MWCFKATFKRGRAEPRSDSPSYSGMFIRTLSGKGRIFTLCATNFHFMRNIFTLCATFSGYVRTDTTSPPSRSNEDRESAAIAFRITGDNIFLGK